MAIKESLQNAGSTTTVEVKGDTIIITTRVKLENGMENIHVSKKDDKVSYRQVGLLIKSINKDIDIVKNHTYYAMQKMDGIVQSFQELWDCTETEETKECLESLVNCCDNRKGSLHSIAVRIINRLKDLNNKIKNNRDNMTLKKFIQFEREYNSIKAVIGKFKIRK